MIIVTGANGFIGSALVGTLNEARYGDTGSERGELIVVDTIGLQERPQLLAGKTYSKFLLKDEIWKFLGTPEAQNVTAILHMGACSSTTETNAEFLRENNTEYTQRLWNWCTKNQKTFIYASSGAVYGGGEHGFDDATPSETFKPLNLYGESKAAFDRWAVEQKETPPVWFGLRFFNVYGPNEYFKKDMASLVFKAFNQIQDTGALKLFRSHNPQYKDGEQMRDFVYVKDITRWTLELLKQDGKNSGIYNMGYGEARTWVDLARAIFENLGRPMKIDWIDIPSNIRQQYQYFTEAKTDRLMSLGLSAPQWPIEKGVSDYVKNYLLKPRDSRSAYL